MRHIESAPFGRTTSRRRGVMGLVASCISAACLAQDAQKTDTTAASHVIVEGQVTDAAGSGQSGVTVTVRRKPADGSEGDLIATTSTNDVGDFAAESSEVIRGEIVVTLSKPQFADIVHVLTLEEGGATPFLGEVLLGNLTLSGRVVNVLGRTPIAAARVQLQTGAQQLRATTGEEGRFSISGVSPGQAVLIVESDRFGRERQILKRTEDAGERDIVLKPDRTLHLKVTDEAGKPIPNVTVECLDQPRTDLRQGVTDAQGMATFSGIHFDAFLVSARLTHPDYASSATFDRSIMTPSDQRESTHEFTLVRAGALTGRVTSTASGGGLHGARVLVGDQYSDSAPRDWTSPEGQYAIRGVRPGSLTVTVHLAGYAPDLKIVEITPAKTTTIDFALNGAATVEGVVKDDKGSPVTNAEIVAVAWRSKSTLGLRAMTDDQGRFRMENAPEDSFEIMVDAPNREPFSQTVQASKGNPVAILLPQSAANSASRSGPLQVGDVAPEITLKTLNGETIKLADLRGKTVLLDFWATWCTPCVDELKHFIAVQEKYGSRKDFIILGISRDYEIDTVREHLRRFPKITWSQVVGDAGGVRAACEGFGVTGLPEVFLIDPEGRVIANKLRQEHIVQAVDDALKAKSPG